MKRDPNTGKIYYEKPGEMAAKPIPVRLPVEVDKIVREIPDRSAKLRQWIIEGMQREELL